MGKVVLLKQTTNWQQRSYSTSKAEKGWISEPLFCPFEAKLEADWGNSDLMYHKLQISSKGTNSGTNLRTKEKMLPSKRH